MGWYIYQNLYSKKDVITKVIIISSTLISTITWISILASDLYSIIFILNVYLSALYLFSRSFIYFITDGLDYSQLNIFIIIDNAGRC